MAKDLNISISAESLFNIGGVEVTNTLLTTYLVTAFIVLFLIYANRKIKSTDYPTGLQNVLEMIVDGLYKLVEGVAGKTTRALAFTPIIGAFLVFILINNWVEHIPGFHTIYFTGESKVKLVDVPAFLSANEAFASTVDDIEVVTVTEAAEAEPAIEEGFKAVLLRGANADINMTLALGILSVVLTQVFGLYYVGVGYLKKFFDFSSPVAVFVGLLELISEFAKIVSFSFRLFGNIFAGEVLVAVIAFLVPALLPIPFIGFELFIGALQAYVFAMLTLVFLSIATEKHH